jgi:hypothetical protein
MQTHLYHASNASQVNSRDPGNTAIRKKLLDYKTEWCFLSIREKEANT